jgi:hypothetical protein
MNVEIGTEAPIFLFWEYLFQIFGILSLQCTLIGGSASFFPSFQDKEKGLHPTLQEGWSRYGYGLFPKCQERGRGLKH